MTTYRHPELGEWKTGDEPIEFVIKDNNGEEVIRRRFADDGLLYIGFEEVKEELKQDWIDSAIKEMEQYFTYNEAGVYDTMPEEYDKYGRNDLRKIIEKYMPQQKKLTTEDIKKWWQKLPTIEKLTTDLLRDHGLLEE